ncbi:response regulator [Persicimonas caeni]|uniref:Response regulator n=1 Tax=Persicimonas caeni TaxID=2292766 RepID=A0A4Y6PT48_PERCE|nr:response regulator [Persicimonas caeni]QDG51309.1 response regulator [Persicimonas caeni]QED32530.1 response regulator [Persicimonas caeni]
MSSSKRILVIDDSRAMRMLIARSLRKLDCEVVEACDGQDALDQLDQIGPIDGALVDWNMPRMNGIDFVRAVRGKPHWDTVPLVMVTSETDVERISEALESGANEYVIKPFTDDGLTAKLQTAGVLE